MSHLCGSPLVSLRLQEPVAPTAPAACSPSSIALHGGAATCHALRGVPLLRLPGGLLAAEPQ